jgi:protein tyrosine phosphatase (PTP) superfamily phosphohydrolase (DUF442 family)
MSLSAASPKLLIYIALGAALAIFLIVMAVRLYNARVYHFAEVDKGILYRDGMRHPAQFAASCAKAQIKTVISLIGDDEVDTPRFAPALANCRASGIKTLRVAIPLGGWPTTENIQKFLELVQDPANRPTIAHCREGVRRTGMMVSAYRLSIMGMTKEQAKAALETFGHSRRSIGDVERFIDLYDPVTRSVAYTNAEKTVSANE